MVGKTILIVDENPASRAFLAKYLRAKQFEILEAPTGKEALILAWRHEPDLVLFDPVLADIPNKEFIQKLRNDARTEKVRLVALSSDPGPARRESCLSAGVDDYLVKSSQAIPSLEQILEHVFTTETSGEDAPEAAEKSGLLIVFLCAKGGNFALANYLEIPYRCSIAYLKRGSRRNRESGASYASGDANRFLKKVKGDLQII